MKYQDTDLLNHMWNAAIDAVSGKQSVSRSVSQDSPFEPDLIIAVGKAAVGMTFGALDALKNKPKTIVVTKYNHSESALKSLENVTVIESAHPIPDAQSLHAGDELIAAIDSLSESSKLLMLVSGGASSLVESLEGDLSLLDLQRTTDELIASGATIEQINAKRKSLSKIKDGKLLECFSGKEIRVYAISDVEGDAISTIGSGIGDCKRVKVACQSRIIASNRIARQAAAQRAEDLGCQILENSETLYADVFDLAETVGQEISEAARQQNTAKDKPKIMIWGGEPTVRLPENPGSGGRNQSLALAISEKIQGLSHVTVLVAGTDGTDGPTDAAGGIVNGETWQESARDFLAAADAGTYLRQKDAILITGPTNTNVMDLVIAIIH